MTDKRLILALPILALLAACGGETAGTDGRAASGEVLEGTISDAMLPVDRVRSEPPLEDPEAFSRARSGPGEGGAADGEEDAEDAEAGADGAASPTPEVTPAVIED